MNKLRRAALIALCMSLTLPLAGCWNSRELSSIGIALTISVDKAKANDYKVTLQVVNPNDIAGGKLGASVTTAPVILYSGTGRTIFEAIRRVAKKTPRPLYFAHVSSIVVGEAFAREGIRDLFDLFERSRELRLTSMLLIARGGTGEDIIRTLSPLERIPSNDVTKKAKTTNKMWSGGVISSVQDIIKQIVMGKENQPVATGIHLVGKPKSSRKVADIQQTDIPTSVEVNGVGIFRDAKLIGWMTDPEIRGMLRLKNKLKSAVTGVSCENIKQGASIEIYRSKTYIEAKVEGEQVSFDIRIAESGNVAEARCKADFTKSDLITKMQNDWSKVVKEEVMAAVKVAKSNRSDVLGLGATLHLQNPKAWKKIKKDWDRYFVNSRINIKVDTLIFSFGMRKKTYIK